MGLALLKEAFVDVERVPTRPAFPTLVRENGSINRRNLQDQVAAYEAHVTRNLAIRSVEYERGEAGMMLELQATLTAAKLKRLMAEFDGMIRGLDGSERMVREVEEETRREASDLIAKATALSKQDAKLLRKMTDRFLGASEKHHRVRGMLKSMLVRLRAVAAGRLAEVPRSGPDNTKSPELVAAIFQRIRRPNDEEMVAAQNVARELALP